MHATKYIQRLVCSYNYNLIDKIKIILNNFDI